MAVVAPTADALTGEKLFVRMQVDDKGVVLAPARPRVGIVLHVGPPVYIECDRAGHHHKGRSVHGHVDLIPAGVPSRWEMSEKDTALIVGVSTDLLKSIAEEADVRSDAIEIANRFQIRDRRIEHLGWALKEELESGYVSGRLYVESLAVALGVHLLKNHSAAGGRFKPSKGGLAGHRLKEVLVYIEDNLDSRLSLDDIAKVARLSASHCKTAFRDSMGMPLHAYVIERRVDRARSLLLSGNRPISQVAVESGFSHASHLAHHMRRILGVSPRSILRQHRQ